MQESEEGERSVQREKRVTEEQGEIHFQILNWQFEDSLWVENQGREYVLARMECKMSLENLIFENLCFHCCLNPRSN